MLSIHYEEFVLELIFEDTTSNEGDIGLNILRSQHTVPSSL